MPPDPTSSAEPDTLPQVTGDLGDRLWAALTALFERGLGPIIALGADSPDLPLKLLEEAFSALLARRCDVALCPSDDGGYTLVGLGKPHRALFIDVPWSTPDVLRATVQRCQHAGLELLTLPEWYDVDDHASLVRLRDSVGSRPEELPALHHFFQGESSLRSTPALAAPAVTGASPTPPSPP